MQCTETTLGNGTPIESAGVFAAARQGDQLANSLIEEDAEILGRGFTSLIHIFSPDIVVMGGAACRMSLNGFTQEFRVTSAGGQCPPSAMFASSRLPWAKIPV